jgi:hypothetical protein
MLEHKRLFEVGGTLPAGRRAKHHFAIGSHGNLGDRSFGSVLYIARIKSWVKVTAGQAPQFTSVSVVA